MITMVDNLIAAYAESIKNLDWMSEETKKHSLVKLSSLHLRLAIQTSGKTTRL